MRIASQFVAFLVVLASLAGPCLAANKAGSEKTNPIENSAAILFTAAKAETSDHLSVVIEASEPCKNDCKKRQCTKTVISRVVTQVRFVLLPISDGPFSLALHKTRLRDQKLSILFAKNTRSCNSSVDLFALCRQLN